MKEKTKSDAILGTINRSNYLERIKEIDNMMSQLRYEKIGLQQRIKTADHIYSYCKTDEQREQLHRTYNKYYDKKLTARELHILSLLSEFKTSKEIADECFISQRAVKFHRTNILKKLGVRTLIEFYKLDSEVA